MQNQATTETESPEQISARLIELVAKAYEAIPKTHPKLAAYCYFSVYRSGGGDGIQFHVAGINGADFTAPSLQNVIALIREYNPEAERQKKIATLKAELATLEGGAL
jgi:hypothetical protein